MQHRRRIGWASKLSLSVVLFTLAGTASADFPLALDRAPANAAVVIGIRSVVQLRESAEALAAKFEPEAANQIMMIDQLLDTDGFNKAGSAAMVMMADPDAGVNPQSFVVILPVSDWAKFSAAMGGDDGAKQTTLAALEGLTARDIGGGFIALGPEPSMREYKDVAGQLAAHKTALGAVGGRVADTADIIFSVSAQAFAQQISAGLEAGKAQAQAAAGIVAGANPDAPAQLEAAMKGLEAMVKDAQSFTLGFTMNKVGVAVDAALHFKEGSESAKNFTHSGSLNSVTGSLPKLPYLAAFAADVSHPVARAVTKAMNSMSQGGSSPLGSINAAHMDKLDAIGVILGVNPALITSGLFAKTLTFEKTSDPAAFLAVKREQMTKLSGEHDGVKITATFTPDESEIAGQKVDRFKGKFEILPDSPLAQNPVMGILLGSSGEVGALMTSTKNGVLTTMSSNSELMTKAIQAQNGQGSLSSDADFAAVAEMLPPGRAFEGFLGLKGISDTAKGILENFGSPLPMEVAEETAPIALGVTANTGGIGGRLIVPTKVVDIFAEMSKKMKQMEEGGDQPAGEKPGEEKPGERRKPRF